MKEFRDAKRAMERELKEKDRDAAESSGRRRKKKGAEQPLLRAAILNNAAGSRGKE